MSAIHEYDVTPSNFMDDDDDGMPPLVDNPNPSMTFTFFTDMTPITALSADPTIPFESVWENSVSPLAEPASPVDVPETPERAYHHIQDRASHSKKRDASYIPRPPNAFILFRSSFIRSQQVPEKVEGNHSTLSKIIGKYWKTLPREEREVWEAKALVAQAEHRKRYPDWRFRPGANAFAKLKVKDGPQASNRKRINQAGRKVKGDPAKKRTKSGDERCAIIADLLVEGKTGVDLEDAVRRWEDSAGKGNGAYDDAACGGTRKDGGDERDGAQRVNLYGKFVSNSGDEASALDNSPGVIQGDRCNGHNVTQPRAQTPDATHDDRFRIPLTAMFKRSLSAPATHASPTQVSHQRHDSFESVFANVSYDIESPQTICLPAFPGDHGDDLVHAVSGDTIGSLSPLVLPSLLREGAPARWNDPYNLLETSLGLPPAPDPEYTGLTYTLQTPDVSPVDDSSLASYAYCTTGGDGNFDTGLPLSTYAHEPKTWAECTLDAHVQIPIFVNAYAGEYDWCACPHAAYGYTCASGGGCDLLGIGEEYARVRRAAECLPAVAY